MDYLILIPEIIGPYLLWRYEAEIINAAPADAMRLAVEHLLDNQSFRLVGCPWGTLGYEIDSAISCKH